MLSELLNSRFFKSLYSEEVFFFVSTDVVRYSVWAATETDRKLRDFFLSHPSADQKNNIRLFKVCQWMQGRSFLS